MICPKSLIHFLKLVEKNADFINPPPLSLVYDFTHIISILVSPYFEYGRYLVIGKVVIGLRKAYVYIRN